MPTFLSWDARLLQFDGPGKQDAVFLVDVSVHVSFELTDSPI